MCVTFKNWQGKLFQRCTTTSSVVEPRTNPPLKATSRLSAELSFSSGSKWDGDDSNTLQHQIELALSLLYVLRLRPRVLVDVSRINTSTTILGFNVSAPILIAPTGAQRLAHPEGEVATARAAAACKTIMVLSFSSSCKLEEVASSCDAIRFFQLYVYKRRDVSATLVRRAEEHGFKAIVMTVDTPKLGRREADVRNKMIAPQLRNLEGLVSIDVDPKGGSSLQAFASAALDPSLSWKDVAWLKSITSLPILIKGVLTAEDAKRAVEVGVAGVIVSNHGGRQLDHSPPSISALEEVVQAVGGVVPVLLDGGIRRGTDVFKAMALGAKAVLIGRPVVYGLAAKGESGARRVVEMLKDEFELTMALAGCPSLKDITRSHVQTERDRLRSLM